jgi:hypothetical protein
LIRIDDAPFGLFVSVFPISQLDLLVLDSGLRESIEDFQVQDRLGAGAKGDGLSPIGQVQRDGVG